MILNKETAAQDALRSVHHGMQFNINAEDWPLIRDALVAQATVWQTENVQTTMIRLLLAEIARHDNNIARSSTGIIVLS